VSYHQIIEWQKETKEVFSYMRKLALDLKAPVFQMFMRPFGKPWVILTDFREAFDICATRKEEFDRSAFTGEVFGPIVPESHIQFLTDDRWRAHRNLMRDTMSNSFVSEVIGPRIHKYVAELVSLWHDKARLAQGRPFDAESDVARCLVDFITSANFGYDVKALQTHHASLDVKVTVGTSGVHLDTPMSFKDGMESEACAALVKMTDGVAMAVRSPFPRILVPLAYRFLPSYSKAKRYTYDMISNQVNAAWARFSSKKAGGKPADEQEVRSALELLVQRESQMARKENRERKFNLPIVRDELLAFLFAGQVTTGAALGWALKYLTMHQEVQKKMRSELRAVHRRAVEAGDMPTAQEIAEANLPYLDAFLAENHRFAVTISCMIRYTIKDTTVLGHRIPKGTDVFMLTNGPNYHMPAMPVDEATRSKSSQDAKDKYGTWDESDMGEFRPERWLERTENGEERYNAVAGPSIPFGVGPRGCFGEFFGQLAPSTDHPHL
jgi:cytochrome P450